MRTSVALLEQSGNDKELYKSCIALAEIFLYENDEKNAEAYANKSWKLLSKSESSNFPNRLFRLVTDNQSIISFSNQLETTWLELRHVINEERMLTRLLTSMCRLLKAECGVFVTLGAEGMNIKLTQNVEITKKDTNQLKRIRYIISKSAQTGRLDINYKFSNTEVEKDGGKVRTPKYSICIPFVKDGKTFAALYMESFYVNEALTDNETEMIKDFAEKMGEPLFAVLDYETMSGKAITIEEGEKSGRTISAKNTQYCESKDSEVKFIFSQIAKVAETNIPVLIIGETGVGKEVFAREVYEKSNYKKTFIKVNCGAIPESLIESELFGYEKGSFTGATQRKKGYFELADGGTIFLDEIGELSLMAQVKLLRVLQEHEIMRVGGNSAVKVNFRLVAATNKELRSEVERGTFRKDLYYRLNVVQLQVPPLRNRKEDIINFAEFFVKKFCAEQGKDLCRIDEESRAKLIAHDWPGNIRELENIMQKAVLFSKNSELSIDLNSRENINPTDFTKTEPQRNSHEDEKSYQLRSNEGNSKEWATALLTLSEMERKYIEDILEKCHGKISGPGGAAEVLGLKRTTLISRMHKLGIR